jgi:hypothetical protein
LVEMRIKVCDGQTKCLGMRSRIAGQRIRFDGCADFG